jgi:hypothetical protein
MKSRDSAAPGGTVTQKNQTPPAGQDAAGGGIWSNGPLTVENQTVIKSNSATRRFLDAPDPGQQAGAFDGVLEEAETAAIAGWEWAKGGPPAERRLAAITEAAEMPEGLAVELTGDQGGPDAEARP